MLAAWATVTGKTESHYHLSLRLTVKGLRDSHAFRFLILLLLYLFISFTPFSFPSYSMFYTSFFVYPSSFSFPFPSPSSFSSSFYSSVDFLFQLPSLPFPSSPLPSSSSVLSCSSFYCSFFSFLLLFLSTLIISSSSSFSSFYSNPFSGTTRTSLTHSSCMNDAHTELSTKIDDTKGNDRCCRARQRGTFHAKGRNISRHSISSSQVFPPNAYPLFLSLVQRGNV